MTVRHALDFGLRRPAVLSRRYTERDAGGREHVSQIFPCAWCGALDCRDADHTQGCPSLPAVPDEEVFRRQRAVMAAWRGRG